MGSTSADITIIEQTYSNSFGSSLKFRSLDKLLAGLLIRLQEVLANLNKLLSDEVLRNSNGR